MDIFCLNTNSSWENGKEQTLTAWVTHSICPVFLLINCQQKFLDKTKNKKKNVSIDRQWRNVKTKRKWKIKNTKSGITKSNGVWEREGEIYREKEKNDKT